MIETSNSQDPVETTGLESQTPAEGSQIEQAPEQVEKPAAEQTEKPELSLKDKIMAKKVETPAVEKTETPAATTPEKPAYEANFKYKAFGKEKEIDEFWRGLVKDPESEKKVKEVFTRADAFDDMKGRYENMSTEHQKTLQQFTALDRDVRRVTKFLNTGDYDNFFASLRISDDQLLQHLQRKAELAKLSPVQQQHYQQGVQARAENLIQQENYEEMQSNYANQRAMTRTMQLDMTLMRPEVSGIASAWDTKMGLGAFRRLVIDEGAKHYLSTKEDLGAEDAINLVVQKFGKLIEQTAPQAPAAQTQAPTQGQPTQTVQVQGKPVIPNVKGRGTSPVKQAPKSLDDLKKMAKEAMKAEMAEHVAI